MILWNEKGEITETAIANIVVEIEGRMLTPKLECGLLPGTLRSHLLAKGEISEQVIPLEMLKECDRIFRINSVRKWVECVLD